MGPRSWERIGTYPVVVKAALATSMDQPFWVPRKKPAASHVRCVPPDSSRDTLRVSRTGRTSWITPANAPLPNRCEPPPRLTSTCSSEDRGTRPQ
jgi:hypothetical protein